MSELPIEGPIARVAVEAHRHRLTVVRRRGDRIAVACAVLRRWRGAIRIIAGRLCRRHASRRRLPRRCRRHPGERKLRALGGLQRSDQLANRLLADPQPVRDRPLAQRRLGWRGLGHEANIAHGQRGRTICRASVLSPQQLRQLGDVGGDAPGFVA
jgi:hypothetical protein